MKNPATDYDLLEQLIPTLMQRARERYLCPAEALPLIQQKRGVIPIAISPAPDRHLTWLDVGDYPFREWKFRESIAAAVKGRNDVTAFTTDLSVLDSPEQLPKPLPIGGFIFQMSRCGSTLFAKALASCAAHVVTCEGTTLSEGLWGYLTQDWCASRQLNDAEARLLRTLIELSCRARDAHHQVGFVKFISWNTLFINQIRQAFPEVPCYFLYREPIEVLASTYKRVAPFAVALRGTQMAERLTGLPPETTETMSDTAFYIALYKAYFLAALNSCPDHLTFLNYRDLVAENFAQILKGGFHYTPSSEALAVMQQQFKFNAKEDSNASYFVSDCIEKRRIVTVEMQQAVAEALSPLYAQLENSRQNLARYFVSIKRSEVYQHFEKVFA